MLVTTNLGLVVSLHLLLLLLMEKPQLDQLWWQTNYYTGKWLTSTHTLWHISLLQPVASNHQPRPHGPSASSASPPRGGAPAPPAAASSAGSPGPAPRAALAPGPPSRTPSGNRGGAWRKEGRKDGNVLFNDALNTFYLRLYGVGHMVKYHSGRKEMFYLTTHSTHFYLRLYGIRHTVKDHSDRERGNLLPPNGLLFPISSKGSFIFIPPPPAPRQDSTYDGLCYTSRGALAVMRNSSMDPPHEGSSRWSIAPWANALTTELHLTPAWKKMSRPQP